MIIGYVTTDAADSGFGSGKTLLMTARLYRRFQQGYQVRTNYGARFETQPLQADDLITQDQQLRRIAMGADELPVWMDARLSAKNVPLTHFILQTRKRHVFFHYTTQDFIQVDKRVRRNTDYLVECQPLGHDRFYYRVTRPRTGRLVRRFTLNGRQFYSLFNTDQIVAPIRRPAPVA